LLIKFFFLGRDSFNENEKKEREEDSKFVNKKPGSIYESIHAPRVADPVPTVIKPDFTPKPDSPPKSDTVSKPDSTPYINENRVLSGGVAPQVSCI
jgi:hypothetical protein